MKASAITVLCLMAISGCSSNGVCDFPLVEEGWMPTLPPAELIDDHNKHADWYKNEGGDFVACPDLKRKGVCSNVWRHYKRLPDGKYEEDEIVCMT